MLPLPPPSTLLPHPLVPFSCPSGYSSLFLPLLFSRLFYLFSLHLHFFTPCCCHSLRKTWPFPPARFHILTRWSPCRALSIFVASFSRYVNTLISNLVISELSLSYFQPGLTSSRSKKLLIIALISISHASRSTPNPTPFRPEPLSLIYTLI